MLSPYSRFLIFAAVVVQYAHAVRISYYEAENPLCLQFSASAVAGRGTPVSLAACRINDPSQDFTFKPNGELSVEGTLVTSSGLCLEDANTAVMLKTCNGSPEQTFNLAATQDPTLYQLISFNRNCFTGKPDNSVALEVCLTARTQIFRVSHNNDIPPPRPAPVAIMSFRAQSGNCWEHGGTAGAALRTAPCDNRPVQTFNVIRNIVQGGIFIQTSDSALCVGLKNQDRTANGVFQVEPCTGVNSQLFRNRTALVGGSNIAFANAFAPRFCIGEKSTSVLGISACDATASFVSIARPGPVTDNGDAAAGVPTDAFRIFNNDNLCLSVEPPPSDRRPNFKPCTNNNINQWWYSDFGRIVSKALPNTNAKCLEVIDASNRTGVVPALANCGVNVNQIYLPVPMGGFKYALKFAHTNMCARSTFSTNDGRTYPIQIRCDTTNPTQIFTISKRDGLATRPRPSCANVKARKEWRDMTTAEKQAFFNAVQRLRTTPSRAGRRSFYDDLVAAHAGVRGYIHSTAQFLPWHRTFLQVYEEALQRIDPTVALPFWAWARDGPTPLLTTTNDITQIFSTDPLSLGVKGLDGDNSCIRGGIGAGWTDYDQNRCTVRNYEDHFQVPVMTTIQSFVAKSDDFATFSAAIETAHNTVHMQIGANSRSDMWVVARSPNDPIFFFHHTNVDRYWYLWQLEHPEVALTFSGTMSIPIADGSVTTVPIDIDSILPGFNIPIREALSLGSYGYCATYQPFLGESTLSNRRVRRDTPITPIGNMTTPLDLIVVNANMTVPTPGAGSSKPFFVVSDDQPVYGSGDHGTIPLPPPVSVPDDFIAQMHPKRLFGLGEPSLEEVRVHVEMVRMREEKMAEVERQVKDGMDRFLEQHPGDFKNAMEKAVEEVVVPVMN